VRFLAVHWSRGYCHTSCAINQDQQYPCIHVTPSDLSLLLQMRQSTLRPNRLRIALSIGFATSQRIESHTCLIRKPVCAHRSAGLRQEFYSASSLPGCPQGLRISCQALIPPLTPWYKSLPSDNCAFQGTWMICVDLCVPLRPFSSPMPCLCSQHHLQSPSAASFINSVCFVLLCFILLFLCAAHVSDTSIVPSF
jgi:hypothetical protein